MQTRWWWCDEEAVCPPHHRVQNGNDGGSPFVFPSSPTSIPVLWSWRFRFLKFGSADLELRWWLWWFLWWFTGVWVEAFFSDDDICRRCCLELQLWRWLFVQGVGFVGVYLPSSCLRNVVGDEVEVEVDVVTGSKVFLCDSDKECRSFKCLPPEFPRCIGIMCQCVE
ncbi:hypothetical protein P8452_50710 [Trifolium repens]|nr:hypothetical protein P8452_50710 [Trifolium repens]